jgi:hypothetical protein
MTENKEEVKVKINLSEKSQSRKELIKSRYLLIKRIKDEQTLDKVAEMIESRSR